MTTKKISIHTSRLVVHHPIDYITLSSLEIVVCMTTIFFFACLLPSFMHCAICTPHVTMGWTKSQPPNMSESLGYLLIFEDRILVLDFGSRYQKENSQMHFSEESQTRRFRPFQNFGVLSSH